MRFRRLCEAYVGISATSKRLEKTSLLADLLKEAKEEDLDGLFLLLQGRVFPAWDKTTLGVSQKTAIKAIRTATGREETDIMKLFKKTGDLGEVAAQLAGKKRQATLTHEELTIKEVIATLRKLAATEGTGSVDTKLKTIAKLLGQATPDEARFLIRILLEDLRIGIAEGTIRDGIAWWRLREEGLVYDAEKNAWTEPEKVAEWQLAIQDALDRTNDLGKVARMARKGLAALRGAELMIGTPVRVMLAQRSTGIADAFDRVGKPAAVEYKYDGFRLQIHKDGTEVTLFTRRLENVTEQFPDVVSLIKQSVKQSCILDAEAVGYDRKTGRHRPFQEISQRIRRKYDIGKLAEELPVEVNVFDILFLEGEPVYGLPFRERRALLEGVVPKRPLALQPSELRITDEEKEVEPFYKDALDKGFEGLMFKTLDAPYQPGSRVGTMVKLKPTLDTLDLMVVGAEWGEGKRSGWLTSFTVACQDEEGNLLEIGRVGTGFKELEQEGGLTFQAMTDLLKDEIVSEKGKEVTVRPTVVLELKFEEIQRSPSYGSGYALRFPRVVRVRSDRRECSSLADVQDLFHAQKGKRQ